MGLVLALAGAIGVAGAIVFKIRHILPIGVVKLGISMLQVGHSLLTQSLVLLFVLQDTALL